MVDDENRTTPDDSYWIALRSAYAEACRVYDRDSALGMDEQGIIDNILGALAKLARIDPRRAAIETIHAERRRLNLE